MSIVLGCGLTEHPAPLRPDAGEIVHRVRAGTIPPYRPEVSRDLVDDAHYEMMRQCWDELPHQRPSAASLKRQLTRTVKSVTNVPTGSAGSAVSCVLSNWESGADDDDMVKSDVSYLS